MPIEWSMKSNLPPKCSIVLSMRFSRSSTLVASAGTTIVRHFSASSLIVPMRIDTAVLVRTISAPCSTARSATFHAIECSLRAPKMSPFFPSSRFPIVFRFKNSDKSNKKIEFMRSKPFVCRRKGLTTAVRHALRHGSGRCRSAGRAVPARDAAGGSCERRRGPQGVSLRFFSIVLSFRAEQAPERPVARFRGATLCRFGA